MIKMLSIGVFFASICNACAAASLDYAAMDKKGIPHAWPESMYNRCVNTWHDPVPLCVCWANKVVNVLSKEEFTKMDAYWSEQSNVNDPVADAKVKQSAADCHAQSGN